MRLKTMLHNAIHPVRALDDWWFRVSPERRLDRSPAYICMLLGLMCPTLAIVLVGPVPYSALTTMPEWLQIWMCGCIFLGCGVQLNGALSGSRWYRAKAKVKHCYSLGVSGAPFATAGLFVYGWFIMYSTPNFVAAISAILTPMLGLGIGLQAFTYWLEYRRIDRNEEAMIAIAKHVKAEGDGRDSLG